MNKIIITNSFYRIVAFIIITGVTFFITPFLIRNLGNEKYGIWTLIVSVTGYMGLLDLGLRTTVVKYISQYLAENDYEKIKNFGSSALAVFALAGLVGWILLSVTAFFVENIFKIDSKFIGDIRIILFIMGFDIFLNFIFMIYPGSIAGFQRYDISVRNGLTAFLFKTVLIVIAISYGFEIVALSIIVLLANMTGSILNYYCFKKISYTVQYSFKNFKKSFLRLIFNYSFKNFIINISDRLIYYSDGIIIGIFMPPENITFYTIASTLSIYLKQIVLSATDVLIPAISYADNSRDKLQIKSITFFGTKLIFFILIPISISLLLFGDKFIELWIGNEYRISYIILLILVVSQFLVLSQYGFTLVLYGIAKQDALAWINIFSAFGNVIVSVLLVKKYGLIGVAIGSTVPLCLLRLIFITPMVLRTLNLSMKEVFKELIFPAAENIIILSIFILLLEKILYITGWITFIAFVILTSIFHLIVYYFIFLTGTERKFIFRLLGKSI